MRTFALSTILALSSIPSTMAASCSAIGYLNTNTAGAGLGGTSVSDSSGIKVYKDGKQIGGYTPGKTGKPVCSDLITFSVDGLSDTFSWGATCNMMDFKYVESSPSNPTTLFARLGTNLLICRECHGAYATQTHIDGDPPKSGTDFYGVGVDATSQCKVPFDC